MTVDPRELGCDGFRRLTPARHDDPDLGAARDELGQQGLGAVAVGQCHVQHDQIDLPFVGGEERTGRGGIRRGEYAHVLLLEGPGHQPEDRLLVVHDQDSLVRLCGHQIRRPCGKRNGRERGLGAARMSQVYD